MLCRDNASRRIDHPLERHDLAPGVLDKALEALFLGCEGDSLGH
jgi:hypothetical protein